MSQDYLEEQKQFHDFMCELDQLFVKYSIDDVYVVNNAIQFQRGDYDGWFFGSWLIKKDGVRRFSRPGINEYRFDQITANTDITYADTLIKSDVEPTVAPEINKPLIYKPMTVHTATIPTAHTTLSESVIENRERTTVQDNRSVNVQEVVLSESDIKPELERYISDLAERIYSTAKEMGFPRIIPGNYWSHPKVINAVKQDGFNESAYTIIASNGTYWNEVIRKIKAIELTDKPQKAEPIAKPDIKKEPVTQTETYSTDAKFGIWTISSPDHPESVFLDSEKGRSTICNKAYGWFLIYTHMHPELKNAPTRANISETFAENFNKQQSFRYKWYEFVVDVSYSTPIESENNNA